MQHEGRWYCSLHPFLRSKGWTRSMCEQRVALNAFRFRPQDMLLLMGVPARAPALPPLWTPEQYPLLRSTATKSEVALHSRRHWKTLYELQALESAAVLVARSRTKLVRK